MTTLTFKVAPHSRIFVSQPPLRGVPAIYHADCTPQANPFCADADGHATLVLEHEDKYTITVYPPNGPNPD